MVEATAGSRGVANSVLFNINEEGLDFKLAGIVLSLITTGRIDMLKLLQSLLCQKIYIFNFFKELLMVPIENDLITKSQISYCVHCASN